MRRLTSALAVTAALLTYAAPQLADACSCMKAPSPVIAAKDAEAVFEGKVISVEDFEKSMPPGDYKVKAKRYKVEVIRSWKGMVSAGETVDIETADNSAACGRSYELNTNYLIYASASGSEGSLMDGLCSRTMKSEKAADDFEALGPADGKWEPPADTGGDAGADAGGEDEGPSEPTVTDPFDRSGDDGAPEAGADAGNPPATPQPAEPSSRGCSLGGEGAGPLGLALGLGLLGWRRRRN